MGDGLLAVFDSPDHPDRALAAAVAVLTALEAHLGDTCRVGVGINSGLVLIGTIGAEDVVELGVIGDPVNVAARVQDATRDLGEPLLLTESTHVLLEHAAAPTEPRGSLMLKGKARPVALYGLAGPFVTIPGRPAPRRIPETTDEEAMSDADARGGRDRGGHHGS
jgi:adenylate cyclase